jgi:SAM-dependent methyltransferase
VDFDTSVAHPARVYDYWLGGKDNFAADREAAEAAIAAFPGIISGVRANRAFLGRAVRFLAGRAGIRQFLDIGTGLPTADNTHEVAQRTAAGCRVVYADNDSIVLAHARALLTGANGATSYVHADLRDTGEILSEAAKLLDFSEPVAVILLGILQLIPDADDPWAIARHLAGAVCPGSYLVISHPTADIDAGAMNEMARRLNERSAPAQMTLRTHGQISEFFSGLELAGPGVVAVNRWAPDGLTRPEPRDVPNFCGVAAKP